jgi:hypothetical protein
MYSLPDIIRIFDLCLFTYIIRIVKLRQRRWAGYVTGRVCDAYGNDYKCIELFLWEDLN